jgi:GSCFA family
MDINTFPNNLVEGFESIFSKDCKVVSAGSCFAANLIPYLERAGIIYLRTEGIPKLFADLGQNLGYANFSASYGNVYTSRQLNQLYERACGRFIPKENYWITENKFIDPFRPGLKFTAKSTEEFKFLQESHLKATKKAFEEADVFVFTLGLTECWINREDGSAYPTCPGTIAGEFDKDKYEFINLQVDEIVEELLNFIKNLRIKNPNVKFIITVSPVPLVATATNDHVLVATTYSKSVLRVAAEIVSKTTPESFYFPAYEIITGPQAPDDFFESDRRNVTKKGVEFVMEILLKACGLSGTYGRRNVKEISSMSDVVSRRVIEAECDEAMLDR